MEKARVHFYIRLSIFKYKKLGYLYICSNFLRICRMNLWSATGYSVDYNYYELKAGPYANSLQISIQNDYTSQSDSKDGQR